MIAQTVSRIVSTRAPRMMTTYRGLNSLQSNVQMISSAQQRKDNKLGDAYSKSEGKLMLEPGVRKI